MSEKRSKGRMHVLFSDGCKESGVDNGTRCDSSPSADWLSLLVFIRGRCLTAGCEIIEMRLLSRLL